MDKLDEGQRPAASWETFVLANCGRLGRFPQVHLAPRFPSGCLNLAVRAELPLQENELLVALINSDSPDIQSTIVLTTSRIYWAKVEKKAVGTRGWRKRPPVVQAFGLDYALLAEGVVVEPRETGALEIALGRGGSLPLPGVPRELTLELAAYLKTVGEAARTGVVPPLREFDPALLDRIDRVLPRVAEVSGRVRALNRDLHTFRRDLMKATPLALVTPLLGTACLLIFVVMVLSGVDPLRPATQQLVAWGGNDGVRVVLRHETWRLPASVFIHGGVIHLALNMWCLFTIGPLVERFFGNVATAAIYLVAGIGGAIASMATLPPRVSVGASGAIFGLLGALLVFLIIHRKAVPGNVLRPLRSSALSFVVFNTMFGAVVPNIDQAAHLGGLASGFLGGLVLSRPWPVIHSPWLCFRRLALGLALAGTLAGAGAAAIFWRERTLPPQARLRDFADQVAPVFDACRRSSAAIPSVQDLKDGAEDPQSRQRLIRALLDLRARAIGCLDRLGRVATRDPELQAALEKLVQGQTAQVAAIDASLAYLQSRNLRHLTGAAGLLSSQAAEIRAIHDFESCQQSFLARTGMEPLAPDPRP
jgi:rhomboid protease GluP